MSDAERAGRHQPSEPPVPGSGPADSVPGPGPADSVPGPGPADLVPGPGAPATDPWSELPATGAWRPGDPAGARRFVELWADRPRALTAGGTLGPITMAFESWGRPNPDRSNAVLVLHALTGDSHLVGPAGPGQPTPGWWDGMAEEHGPIDTGRWWVICPNVLGGCHGTTGPSSPAAGGRPWGSRFPALTVGDQVAAEVALADALGIERWAAVIGGSMGGMRVLEWAVGFPDRVAVVIVIACGAQATAEQIALSAVQSQAIRLDPGWAGGDYYDAGAGRGPARGLGTARRIGQISYRSEAELATRFAARPQPGEDPLSAGWSDRGWSDTRSSGPVATRPGARYEVESYLDHQARKLAARFDANSYLVLTRAMDHHDIGRHRGGVGAALRQVTAEVTVVGVDSDRLYPLRLQEDLVAGLPGRRALRIVTSPVGHDGFLVERDQIGKIISDTLG